MAKKGNDDSIEFEKAPTSSASLSNSEAKKSGQSKGKKGQPASSSDAVLDDSGPLEGDTANRGETTERTSSSSAANDKPANGAMDAKIDWNADSNLADAANLFKPTSASNTKARKPRTKGEANTSSSALTLSAEFASSEQPHADEEGEDARADIPTQPAAHKSAITSLESQVQMQGEFGSGLTLEVSFANQNEGRASDVQGGVDSRDAANEANWPRLSGDAFTSLLAVERVKLGMLFARSPGETEFRSTALFDSCANLTNPKKSTPAEILDVIKSDEPMLMASKNGSNTFDFETTSKSADKTSVGVHIRPHGDVPAANEATELQLAGLLQSMADNRASELNIDASESSAEYIAAFSNAMALVQSKNPSFQPGGNWGDVCAAVNAETTTKSTLANEAPAGRSEPAQDDWDIRAEREPGLTSGPAPK